MANNWEKLKSLRTFFLDPDKGVDDYWKENEIIELYDKTLGARIGWKWQTVLAGVKARGWLPPKDFALIDWGCGSGIASRTFLATWPAEPSAIHLYDRSLKAAEFAKSKLAKNLHTKTFTGSEGNPDTDNVLLISHVLNELDEENKKHLMDLAAKAHSIFIVEAGTPAAAQNILQMRRLLQDSFSIVYPCSHQNTCGMESKENQSHWCHQFAKTPQEAFTSANWRQAAAELGIDLRSLPYSALVCSKSGEMKLGSKPQLIGRPRFYKGYGKALVCKESGVGELIFQKRTDPVFFKTFAKTPMQNVLDTWQPDQTQH